MNKPLAIGLIIFFILVISGGAIWLAVRPAPEAEEPERGFLQRFPFGLLGGEEPKATPPGEVTKVPEKRALTLLSSEPVESFASRENGVRFIERETGRVSESGPQGENQTRVSNTTIPKIFDAVWSPDAKKTILKYIEQDSVRVVSVEFVATSTRATVLPRDIISSAFAPDRERVAYLVLAQNGSRLIAADPDNSKQSEITTLSFRDFEIFWPEKNLIYLLSRPSGLAEGALFKYNLQSGALDKILGDMPGLEIKFSKDGKKFIYSSYDASSQRPLLFVYDLDRNSTLSLQARGLAEKCSFGKENLVYCGLSQNLTPALYPDDWMRGAVSTSDTLWEINTETGRRRQLDGQTFDVKQLSSSSDGNYLYFTDKNNGSLWSLQTENRN